MSSPPPPSSSPISSNMIPPPLDLLAILLRDNNNGEKVGSQVVGSQKPTSPSSLLKPTIPLENGQIQTEKPPPARSFLQAASNSIDFVASELPQPCLKGEKIAIKIQEIEYQEGLKVCNFSLHGRLVLSKGDSPPKFSDLKSKLSSLWASIGKWNLIPLGKGFYEFCFSSAEDLRNICSVKAWHLRPGTLKLFLWTPDFTPQAQKLSHTQCWIKIHNLPQEYWRHKILLSIAGGVGVPISLDRATATRSFGHYAKVLVEVDLNVDLPSEILVEREGFAFFVSIEYDNLPAFCSNCHTIGHVVSDCRKLRPKEKLIPKPVRPSRQVTQYIPINKIVIDLDTPAVIEEAAGATASSPAAAVVASAAPLPRREAVGAADETVPSAVSATVLAEPAAAVVPGCAVAGPELAGSEAAVAGSGAVSATVLAESAAAVGYAVAGPELAGSVAAVAGSESALAAPSVAALATPWTASSSHTPAVIQSFDEDNFVVQATAEIVDSVAARESKLVGKLWSDGSVSSDEDISEEVFTKVISKSNKKRLKKLEDKVYNTRRGGRTSIYK